jgi:hypothetical protein
MAYESVDEPVRGAQAFSQQDDRHVQSQAAILLLLRSQLVFAREYVETQRASGLSTDLRWDEVGRTATMDLAGEDLEDFPVPWLSDVTERFGTDAVDRLRQRFGEDAVDAIMERNPDVVAEILPVLAQELFEDHEPMSAALVLEVCLRHPDPLVRAAAAGTYLELSTGETQQGALRALLEGTSDPDPEVCDMAATLLGDSVPRHPRLAELASEAQTGEGLEPLHTALLVHGTWARKATWWQPGGDFHSYIAGKVRQDLYSGHDRFEWSGGYNDQDRAIAGSRLSAWCLDHHRMDVDCIIAHSHGGSVAMMATWSGLRIGELVLLSCPVHQPSGFRKDDLSSLATSNGRYLPDFSRVARIESIRVRLDRVIIADRGGQRFRNANIREHVVGWLKHGTTHDPDTWQRHGIDQWI